jgi:hypothetical protein
MTSRPASDVSLKEGMIWSAMLPLLLQLTRQTKMASKVLIRMGCMVVGRWPRATMAVVFNQASPREANKTPGRWFMHTESTIHSG